MTETALTNLTEKERTRALNRFRMLCPFLEQGVPLTTVAKEHGVALHAQFGPDLASLDNFRRHMLKALEQALHVYPKARAEQVEGGLLLRRSAPPIAARKQPNLPSLVHDAPR